MSQWILRMSDVDRRLLQALALRRVPFLSRFMRAWTHLGDPVVAIGLAGLFLALDLSGGSGFGIHAALSLTLSHLISQFLKRRIARPRPSFPEGLHALIQAPDRFSFPSGHASASLALALPPALALGIGPGGALLIGALLVGASRCYLGVHYPGDVMAGWLVALASVAGVGLFLG